MFAPGPSGASATRNRRRRATERGTEVWLWRNTQYRHRPAARPSPGRDEMLLPLLEFRGDHYIRRHPLHSVCLLPGDTGAFRVISTRFGPRMRSRARIPADYRLMGEADGESPLPSRCPSRSTGSGISPSSSSICIRCSPAACRASYRFETASGVW